MAYPTRLTQRRAPQSAPIPGSKQVRNGAGGFAWAIDEWTRLRRFLILGSEGDTFYAGEWNLTRENAQALELCLDADGPRAVAEIVAVSEAGRAPKNDPALFALAMAAGHRDGATRKAALEALPRVALIATHLFQFAAFVEGFAAAQAAETPTRVAELVREYGLPREALPSECLTSPEVWEALLEDMPMTALVRNLATMTRIGVLAPGSEGTAKAVEELGDRERIRKARVHPIALLAALRTYTSGRGVRGRGTWTAVPQVVDALEAASTRRSRTSSRRASGSCSPSTCRARWAAAWSPASRV